MSKEAILLKADNGSQFNILKSDELVIGGYASIEIVDKQNDLITLDALKEAVVKYMEDEKYRNVMSNHSNVQVGEVIPSYRDKSGRIHKTEVDDVGFFVVIKLREDIEKAKEVSRGIRKGTLRSFSIGGQALSKRQRNHPELGQYNEIDKLELHEVTICEKGINPEAKFDILKMENKKGENMTEKLEKALEELNGILADINSVRKEDEKEMYGKEDMDMKEDMDEKAMYEKEDEEMMDEEEMMDMETKGHSGPEGYVEDGNPEDRIVVSGGRGTPNHTQETVVKGFENHELNSLNLSVENIEKAYEQFRAEQLEQIAYDNLKKEFQERFEAEVGTREDILAKQNYDAKTEVTVLKEQFAELKKSLTDEKNEIIKAQEVSMTIPEDIPTSIEQIADMSWDDIHTLSRRFV